MNEVLKVLKERRSIRAFRPEPLKKEDLDAIVEAGLYAPLCQESPEHQAGGGTGRRRACQIGTAEQPDFRHTGGNTLLRCAGGHCGAVRQRVSQLAPGRLSGNG